MISLMILLITLTGTTYAWFKINSSATVSGFNFTVTGGEGYQISLNDEKDSYSSQLTAEQMRQAILCGYNSAYTVKNGKLYYNETTEISDSDAADLIKTNILMSPVTPHVITADDLPLDGSLDEQLGKFEFRNQYGSPVEASSGKFLEFSIYVKANGGLQDRNKYDLYLLGSDVEDVVNSNNQVVTVARTSIKSKDKNEIQLKRNMEKINGSLTTGQTVTVYTSNALRFSIGDDNEVLGKDTDNKQIPHTNQIFELSDDQANDLGSYATTYPYANQADKTAGTEIPAADQSTELDNLYNATKNAMFTYYNNIRPYSKLEALDYEKKPNTIRKLPTEQEIKEAADPYNATYKFVEVRSGYSAKKVTFRFWLEGWDADCFDGISQSIRVNLSFGSFKNGIKSR